MNVSNIKSLLLGLWFLMPFGLSGAPGSVKNIFDYAAEGNLSRVSQILAQTGTQHIYDSDGRSLLHHAAFGAHPEFISLMINSGLDVNEIDRDGLRPIHYAILGSNIRAIEFLVSRGAYLNQVENLTCSPLFYAIVYGNKDVVEALLRLGANPMLECNRGMSPVHLAAYLGKLYFFQRFLELCGMQLMDIPTRSGNTLLHCAAARGNNIIATLLLAYGVSPSPLNNDNQTPLRLAFNGGFKNIVLSLLRAESIRGNLPDEMTAIFRFLEGGRQDADLVYIADALNRPSAEERDIHGLRLQDYMRFFEIYIPYLAPRITFDTNMPGVTQPSGGMSQEEIDQWIERILNADDSSESNIDQDSPEEEAATGNNHSGTVEGIPSSQAPVAAEHEASRIRSSQTPRNTQHRVRRWHENAYASIHRRHGESATTTCSMQDCIGHFRDSRVRHWHHNAYDSAQ